MLRLSFIRDFYQFYNYLLVTGTLSVYNEGEHLSETYDQAFGLGLDLMGSILTMDMKEVIILNMSTSISFQWGTFFNVLQALFLMKKRCFLVVLLFSLLAVPKQQVMLGFNDSF